ncbi:MAG: hypothetical protein QOF48_1271, partial [Verrucomicrobiota bacterium]
MAAPNSSGAPPPSSSLVAMTSRPKPPTVLEPLSSIHDAATFDCGAAKTACSEINEFIRHKALHAQESLENETFILRYSDDKKIRAFITLAAGSLQPKQLKVDGWDTPITGTHIAYLGADLSVAHGHWGRFLVDWAIRRCEELGAIRTIHLFAYPDMVAYYEGIGFDKWGKAPVDNTGQPRQLMILDMLEAT